MQAPHIGWGKPCLLEFVSERFPDVPESIRSTGQLSDATQEALRRAIDEFKGQFTPLVTGDG